MTPQWRYPCNKKDRTSFDWLKLYRLWCLSLWCITHRTEVIFTFCVWDDISFFVSSPVWLGDEYLLKKMIFLISSNLDTTPQLTTDPLSFLLSVCFQNLFLCIEDLAFCHIFHHSIAPFVCLNCTQPEYCILEMNTCTFLRVLHLYVHRLLE